MDSSPSVVIAFRLRRSERQAEQWRDDLAERKLLDLIQNGTYRIHDWDKHQYSSDASTQRVRKHRDKQRQDVSRNVTVTPPDTEQIQSRTETDTDTDPKTQRAFVDPIRTQERNRPGEISPATWDSFRKRYEESGKPLNEAVWTKAGMEVATLNLRESDFTEQVIPSLSAELPGWSEREISMIPFPANWLKAQPWTRKAKPRDPPLTREERRRQNIDREWAELGNGNR